MGYNKGINDRMEFYRLVIWNSNEDEIIRTRFEPFGIDESRHQANKDLYNETSSLIAKNESEHAEWRKASDAFSSTKEVAQRKLSKATQFLKFWYDANSPEAVDLGLYNNKMSKYSDLMNTGRQFYSVLLANEAILTKLIPFGYTAESITNDQNELLSLDKLRLKREQESGDAQVSIKERNAKLDELDECVAEMVRLARLIFVDAEAQYLEKLGVVVRS